MFLRVKLSLCYFRTALMLAVKHESSNTVRLLLQHNVDVSAVDDRGWTAENYAAFKTLRM